MAAQAEDIKRLKERLEGHPGPVLSVYLSVNAGLPENQGQAYKVRLKDALREMDEVPDELAEQVRESVEGEVREHASYGVALVEAEEFRFFVSAPLADPGEGSDGSSSGFFREVDLKPQGLYP